MGCDCQLEPVARAIEAPRVTLLMADVVGLGMRIEAGLVALELLRHRAKRIMIVCPPGLMVKWQDEMAEKTPPIPAVTKNIAPQVALPIAPNHNFDYDAMLDAVEADLMDDDEDTRWDPEPYCATYRMWASTGAPPRSNWRGPALRWVRAC